MGQATGPWQPFFTLTGTSAAALIGLMFIVITLVTSLRDAPRSSEGTSNYSTPTVVHFAAALIASAILLAPWRSPVPLAAIIAALGVFGLCYAGNVAQRIRAMEDYRPDFEDWLCYACLPLCAYAALIAGAVLMTFAPRSAMFACACGIAIMLFVGIHNAWDIVTFVTVTRRYGDDRNGEKDA